MLSLSLLLISSENRESLFCVSGRVLYSLVVTRKSRCVRALTLSNPLALACDPLVTRLLTS